MNFLIFIHTDYLLFTKVEFTEKNIYNLKQCDNNTSEYTLAI